jgi:hypothetical protein
MSHRVYSHARYCSCCCCCSVVHVKRSLVVQIWSVRADIPTCTKGCSKTWGKCAGTGITGVQQCCSEKDHCVQKNASYSQCLEKSKKLPAWPGVRILTCNRERS